MGRKSINLTGQRSGRLVAVEEVGKIRCGKRLWRCLCDCGQEVTVISDNFRRGNTQSCGCLKQDVVDERSTTHGMSKRRIYKTWSSIKQRCDNPSNSNYINYGGRGITYCEKWGAFEGFYEDMGPTYEEHLEIDRIDVNGNYEPSNCRWATENEQGHVKRKKGGCSSEYIGVNFVKRTGKWGSTIKVNCKKKHIGYFANELEAATAYDNASEQYYGDRHNKTSTI